MYPRPASSAGRACRALAGRAVNGRPPTAGPASCGLAMTGRARRARPRRGRRTSRVAPAPPRCAPEGGTCAQGACGTAGWVGLGRAARRQPFEGPQRPLRPLRGAAKLAHGRGKAAAGKKNPRLCPLTARPHALLPSRGATAAGRYTGAATSGGRPWPARPRGWVYAPAVSHQTQARAAQPAGAAGPPAALSARGAAARRAPKLGWFITANHPSARDREDQTPASCCTAGRSLGGGVSVPGQSGHAACAVCACIILHVAHKQRLIGPTPNCAGERAVGKPIAQDPSAL